MATVATAATVNLAYDVADLGGGLNGFTFYITNDDGILASYAVNIGFEGADGATIQQVGAFGGAVVVNKQDDANLYGGMPAATYDKTLDTWAMNPFANNAIAGVNPLTGVAIDGGYTVGANMFAIALGTGPGSQIGSPVNVAYVVASGEVHVKYIVARSGLNYTGEYVTPEPATLSLLGLGALALIRRRK
jgi:hypothetical protein